MKKFESGPSIKDYNKLNHWFDFNDQNVLKVYSGKVDIGQHISSTLALITSKITGIKYDQVEIIKLNTDLSPNEGITASSLSVANSGSAIKAASIILKTSFINYALKYLNIQKDDMLFENGIIKDRKSNISLTYWDFSKTDEFKELIIPESIDEETLNTLNYVNNQKIELKTIKDIVTGSYKYVHDMTFSKMLHARIVRPPSYHSRLVEIDKAFKEKLKKNKIELFVKGSFVAILSTEEFLVVKYLELSKKKYLLG